SCARRRLAATGARRSRIAGAAEPTGQLRAASARRCPTLWTKSSKAVTVASPLRADFLATLKNGGRRERAGGTNTVHPRAASLGRLLADDEGRHRRAVVEHVADERRQAARAEDLLRSRQLVQR